MPYGVGGKHAALWAPFEQEARVLAAATIGIWPEAIGPDSFYSEMHAVFFRTCQEERAKGRAFDAVAIARLLRAEYPAGMAFVLDMMQRLEARPSIRTERGRALWEDDVRSVRRAAARRALAHACWRSAAELSESDEPTEDVARRLEAWASAAAVLGQ